MKTRTLGKTNYTVSEIGLGTWQFGGDFGEVHEGTVHDILSTARSSGVNFWDTADVYGAGKSEERIGAFQDKAGVFVATKLGRGPQFEGMTVFNKARIKESITGSIKRLNVEALDLAQLHCIPTEVLRDGEVFTIMDEIQKEGLVRHWGASVENLEEAKICLEYPGIATLQVIFNLLRQDYAWEILPLAKEKNVGIIVRLPLASGLLSGKWTSTTTFAPQDHRNYNQNGDSFNVGETFSGLPFEKGIELIDELKETLAGNTPLARTALRWILDHDAVSTVIAGVTRAEQLQANTEASQDAPLPEAMHEQLRTWYSERVKPHIRGRI